MRDFQYATVNEILEILLKTYCAKIGIEFMHMSKQEKKWVKRSSQNSNFKNKEESPYKPDRTFLAFVDTAFLASF